MTSRPVANKPAASAAGAFPQAQPVWHVWWRTAWGCRFFDDRSSCERIRDRLLGAHVEHGRVLVNFLILPTEIHVLARPGAGEDGASIARAIGHVLARWARNVNRIHGPVLAGPYRARALVLPDAVREEVRMLAWRPVSLGLCALPSYYPHGGFRVAIGLSAADGFVCTSLLQLYGANVLTARAALRVSVSLRPAPVAAQQWELDHGLALASGTVGPHRQMAREVRGVAASLVAASGQGDIDGALRLLAHWVAGKVGADASDELQGAMHPASARGRALVAMLARRHGLCSAASVARFFGRAKATLSEKGSAIRGCPKDRAILETPPKVLVEQVLGLSRQRKASDRAVSLELRPPVEQAVFGSPTCRG